MKKKIVVFMLIISILAVMFAGCNRIISKNDQRDFEQSIATVEYSTTVNGQSSYQTSDIMKGEFALSFNNNAYYYVQYYSMTYSQAGTYIINSLAQRELMVLFAKAYVIEHEVDGLSVDKLPENCSIRELLTAAEIEKAINDTNDDMKTALDNVIKDLIEEDENNNPTEDDTETVEDSSDDEVTFKVIFDADGGESDSTLYVGQGKKVVEPADPTKDGYTFGGWQYASGDKAGQMFDFANDVITERTTLKAVWYEYVAPRTVKPEEEEAEEDFDPLKPVAVQPLYFFDQNYLDKNNGHLTFDDETYWDYVDEAVAQLQKNLASTYRTYDYYLEAQMKTVLLEKFERDVYAEAEDDTDYAEKVQAEYDRMIAQNSEDFGVSDTNYETALKSSLTETYFHTYTSTRYGFAKNILLKFGADELEQLTTAVSNGTSTVEQIKALRDSIAQNMTILVSNPDYDPDATCDNTVSGEIEGDPMTDPNHLCNSTPDDNTTEDYNHMIDFVYSADEGWHVAYNVSECATMAYLKTEWPAFTNGEKVGVVNQIKATLDKVIAAKNDATNPISYTESIYWIREVSDAWLYLVGDDSGSTSTDSNNNGLGYLISAEGESGYIGEFETQARDLIAIGTGSYSVSGTLETSYVVGDNFIDEGTTDSAYAGIFFLVITDVPYDPAFYAACGGTEQMTNGKLPLDYVIEVAKNSAENKTVYDELYDKIFEGRKNELYSTLVNQFMNGKLEGQNGKFTVNEKVYNDYFSD